MSKATIVSILTLAMSCYCQGVTADTGSLILEVLDEEAKPVVIVNVQMWIKTNEGGRAFTFSVEPTDTPGIYKIPKLPSGKYTGLKINKPNFAPGWVKDISVVSGQVSEAKCVLLKGGSVSGFVIDQRGMPIPNIPVVLNSVSCRRDVVTNKHGRFVAKHLYPCKYSVNAEPDRESKYNITSYKDLVQCGDNSIVIVLKNKALNSKPPSTDIQSDTSTAEQEAFEALMTKSATESQKTASRSMLGKPAPPLIIEQWYNSTFWDLKLNNKVVVLHFWGIWCSGCKIQMPGLCQLAEKYEHDNFEVIGIHTDHFKHGLPEYLSKTHLPYIIAVDNNEQTREVYHVTSYPTTVVIDRKGIVRAINPKSLEDDIKQLLSE